MGFLRREYWSALPFLIPGDLPDQGLNPHLLHWQVDSLPLSLEGSPLLPVAAPICWTPATLSLILTVNLEVH